MQVTAIVPSAGSGERMHTDCRKPYITLAGKPLLAHTLEALQAAATLAAIIIPVFPGEEERCRETVLNSIGGTVPMLPVAGGATRQASVSNALQHLPAACTTVLVHDGARPFVTAALVAAGLQAAARHPAVTFAVAVKDTIAEVAQQRISGLLDRERLVRIQTPQIFERGLLEAAHRQALADGFQGTDDASLVQRTGAPVTVLPGDHANIKITTPDDLAVAEAILKRRNTQ